MGHRRAPRTPKIRNYPRNPLKLSSVNDLVRQGSLGVRKVQRWLRVTMSGNRVKQTSQLRAPTSEFDPKRTSNATKREFREVRKRIN